MQTLTPYFKTFGMSFLSMSCLISLASTPATLASDHVDSPSVTVAGPTYRAPATETSDPMSSHPTVASGKPEDITDVYFFREHDQNNGITLPNTANDPTNRVVMVMTLNGLTKPGHSNYFAPDVAYQMKIGTDKTDLDNAAKTRVLNFRFGAPDSNGQQDIYLGENSMTAGAMIGKTAPYTGTSSNVGVDNSYANNNVSYRGGTIKVWAGEADDPFFLDFRVLNEGLAVGVNAQNPLMNVPATGTPGQLGYVPAHNIDNLATNVNLNRTPGDSFGTSNASAIVVSMPISVLQTGSNESVFYAWGATYK